MKSFIILFAVTLAQSISYAQNHLIWEFATKAGIYSSPNVDESHIYFGSNDSCLYALNKKNGQLTWRFESNGEIRSKPLIFKELVIFNSTDGFIYAANKSDGTIVWKFKTGGEKRLDMWDYYTSSPVSDCERIFTGSGDGHVYSINPENGTLIWKFNTGGIVHATPVINNSKLYIGSYDGYFYSIDCTSGELIWKFKTVGDAYFPLGEIQGGATFYDNSIIFGSRDYNIYALNAQTGRGLWNMKEKGSWIIATPLVFEDIIYFGTSDSHTFYGMNAKNGDVIWSAPLNMRVFAKAASFNNKIVFGCFNGKLYQLNHNTGELKQIFQTNGSTKNYHRVYNEKDQFREGFEVYGNDITGSEKKILELGAILTTPLVESGIVYFGDSNGDFYAVKLEGK